MELVVGAILDGKVTGITKFGAFVALPEGKSGMVHISEISNTYVSEISEHLKEGQEVKVKLLAIDESGRINLSIKKAMPERSFSPEKKPFQKRQAHNERPFQNRGGFSDERKPKQSAPTELSFEDRMKLFMQDSESKMHDLKHNLEKKTGSRRRK